MKIPSLFSIGLLITITFCGCTPSDNDAIDYDLIKDDIKSDEVVDEVVDENIVDSELIIGGLTLDEAKKIAEKTCILESESLSSGYYNENTKTWWFDANLRITKKGCNPACVVYEATKTAEINWRCSGLLIPDESENEDLKQVFDAKYPKYADTLTITIRSMTENHARGGVVFVQGMGGGNFLAAKIDGKWQIVFDGNGQIPCNLSDYGFPSEMLDDCSE